MDGCMMGEEVKTRVVESLKGTLLLLPEISLKSLQKLLTTRTSDYPESFSNLKYPVDFSNVFFCLFELHH